MSDFAARPSENKPSPKPRISPALTLVVVSPVIAELLSGSTRLSTIFALIPEIMLWGCGALLIREIVRRRGLGWNSLLMMGLALSIAEEFLIQQTSLAPLPFPGARSSYGRVLGVNWLYFLFMLGYESVWVVLVPVQLTELIFRQRRNEPWLRARGLIITCLIFIFGCFVAWYGWVKRVRPMVFHAATYHPPLLTILTGILAMVLLTVAALNPRFSRPSASQPSKKSPLPPVLLGVVALALGLPWYIVISLVFTSNPLLRGLPFWIPMTAAIAWAGVAYVLLKALLSPIGIRDMHRYALTFGAVLVCMIGGFAGSSSWSQSDRVGKIVLDLMAVVLLLVLGRALEKRSPEERMGLETGRERLV